MPLSDEQLSVQAMRAELKAERLVKRKELELLLSVSYPTIWSWIRAGKFPAAIDVCGNPRWRLRDVTAWLDAQPKRKVKSPPNELTASIPVTAEPRSKDGEV